MPVVLWFHGLGLDSDSWAWMRGAFPAAKFVLPQAPTGKMGAFPKEMPCWFDWPGHPLTDNIIAVMAKDGRYQQSLDLMKKELVKIVQKLDQPQPVVENEGGKEEPYAGEKEIVIGGFSQGGALTLSLAVEFGRDPTLGGLLDERTSKYVKGFVCAAGWVTIPGLNVLAGIPDASVEQPSMKMPVPVLWWHGDKDGAVPLTLVTAGKKALMKRYGVHADVKISAGLGHELLKAEKEAVEVMGPLLGVSHRRKRDADEAGLNS